jgi:peptidoglycan hydrolase-like protein with peptidoglycan-binding domain
VAPGQELNVSVDLQAPNATGSFQGFWYLQEPGGAFFELSTGPFWVKIDAVLADLPDWPIFRNGDSGPEVYAIQYLLRHHGSAIAADGAFGPQTRAAVQAFQTSKSLASDGIVGPNTWAELIKNMNVQQGANGERVKALQYLLKEKFGYSINVDGAFGPQTDAAVEDFQIDAGIISDGIVGAQTWRMLVGATP